jgi:pyrroloquinoline quinone biosynthesis protein D
MIASGSRVRLAAKARLKFDRHSQKHMLLYPERGIVLNATAADVVALCAEAEPLTVASIVDRVVAKYGEAQREAIARDVLELLQGLADKGLVEVGS